MEKNNLKKHVWIIAAILLAKGISANPVVISEVFYNPSGADSGQEFLELFNNQNTEVDLTNWSIEVGGTTFAKKATIPGGESIPPKSHYLIAEDLVNSDFNTSLSLQNGGSATDGVRIIDSLGNIVDTVLYDSPNTNFLQGEGIEAPSAPEGKSLSRIFLNDSYQDTNDNSIDFEVTDPNPTKKEVQGSSSSDIALEINILSSKPEIINATILEDDDPVKQGVQILPNPDSKRSVNFEVYATDVDSSDNIAFAVAEFQNQNFSLNRIWNNQNDVLFNGSIDINYFMPANNYSIQLKVFDNQSNSDLKIVYFDFEELLSLIIDTKTLNFPDMEAGNISKISGDGDTSTLSNPTLKNGGNVNLNLFASSTDIGPIGASNVSLSVGNSNLTSLKKAAQDLHVSMSPNNIYPMNINLNIPTYTSMGHYSGTLKLISGV